MSKRDYYQVLGIARDASADDLKKAFRKRAKELHPDQNRDNPKAEEQFKELNEAHEVLKDPQKRAAYDRMGHAAFDPSSGFGGGGGPAGGFGFGGGEGGLGDVFEEIFGEMFGGGRRGGGGASQVQRGSDLRYNMTLSLEEAYRGKKTNVKIAAAAACGSCQGSGGENGAAAVTCSGCRGRGKVRTQSGFFTVERSCPQCGGRGSTISNPCKNCGGTGAVAREKTLEVDIPAGVDDGTRMRMPGEGASGGRGTVPGDLYIFIEIKPHALFQRVESDLACQVPVSFVTLALGGEIDIPTPDGGKSRITVPAGTSGGKKFRLRGKGMPVLRQKKFGDLYIELIGETPVNLSKRQRELLEEFDKAGPDTPETQGFFAKVKDFWDSMKGSNP